ncbi:hypothetical protein Sjap_015434 [Stephania japonica]|uniref:Uncharacterized protein n=1 Tax=Stephania japonica TaxID=461633 RepID=A0AAP0IJD6_9MAGN
MQESPKASKTSVGLNHFRHGNSDSANHTNSAFPKGAIRGMDLSWGWYGQEDKGDPREGFGRACQGFAQRPSCNHLRAGRTRT